MEGFTKNDICKAVAENDREWLAEALTLLGLENKDSRTLITDADVSFMRTLFGHASISAQNDDLEPETIELLIERTLPEINIYDLVNDIMFARGIDVSEDEDEDYEQIPEKVRKAFLDNEYDDEIGDAIMEMSEDTIDVLCSFILKKTESINISFTYPIVRTIYEAGLISDAQLVTAMGFSVKKAHSGGMMPGLGELLALGALGALLD